MKISSMPLYSLFKVIAFMEDSEIAIATLKFV